MLPSSRHQTSTTQTTRQNALKSTLTTPNNHTHTQPREKHVNDTTDPEVRTRLRIFMEQHGRPVQFDNDDPDDGPNFYGWENWHASEHLRENNCTWNIEPGATLTEHTYLQFTDTFHDAANEIGVNATPAHCTCRRYTNQHLRWTGTLGQILSAILKDEDTNGIRL